jgi:hypothetical protein
VDLSVSFIFAPPVPVTKCRPASRIDHLCSTARRTMKSASMDGCAKPVKVIFYTRSSRLEVLDSKFYTRSSRLRSSRTYLTASSSKARPEILDPRP